MGRIQIPDPAKCPFKWRKRFCQLVELCFFSREHFGIQNMGPPPSSEFSHPSKQFSWFFTTLFHHFLPPPFEFPFSWSKKNYFYFTFLCTYLKQVLNSFLFVSYENIWMHKAWGEGVLKLLQKRPCSCLMTTCPWSQPEANMKEAGFVILTPLKTLHTPGKAEVRDIPKHTVRYSTISSRKFYCGNRGVAIPRGTLMCWYFQNNLVLLFKSFNE